MKRKLSICLLLLLFCLPSVGMCSPQDGTVPKEVFLQVLNEWENSTNEFQRLLDEQNEDLKLASEELQSLRNSLAKQKEVQALLRKELSECRIELTKAEESLNAANAELQSIVAGVKDIESKKRLAERQRNFWQVIAAALGIVCVVK